MSEQIIFGVWKPISELDRKAFPIGSLYYDDEMPTCAAFGRFNLAGQLVEWSSRFRIEQYPGQYGSDGDPRYTHYLIVPPTLDTNTGEQER